MAHNNGKVLISLGMSCQTAHQLRRLAALDSELNNNESALKVQSGIFDWLICPPLSVVSLLNNNIPDFTRQDLIIQNNRPYWPDHRLYFWHNFTDGKGRARQVHIDKNFEDELTRWRYLRDKFQALNPANTIFVISNIQNNLETEVYEPSEHDQFQFTPAVIEQLEHSLAAFFGTTIGQNNLQVVTRHDRSKGLISRENTTLFPIDQNEWKGPKQPWSFWWQKLHESFTD